MDLTLNANSMIFRVQNRRPSQLRGLLRGEELGQVPAELLPRCAVRGHVRQQLLRRLQLQQLPRTRGSAAGQRRLRPVRGKQPMQEILQHMQRCQALNEERIKRLFERT